MERALIDYELVARWDYFGYSLSLNGILGSSKNSARYSCSSRVALPSSSSHMTFDCDVVIIGGCIAGMATTLALCNHGISTVRLFEKSPQLRPVGAAIGLFPNGRRSRTHLARRVPACAPVGDRNAALRDARPQRRGRARETCHSEHYVAPLVPSPTIPI